MSGSNNFLYATNDHQKLQNDSRDTETFCSNLCNVGDDTPARSASAFLRYTIARHLARTFSAILIWALYNDVSEIEPELPDDY